MSTQPRPWMVELAAAQQWEGAEGTLVVKCERGHRWGTWPSASGSRCIAEVDDSRYANGLCGYALEAE